MAFNKNESLCKVSRPVAEFQWTPPRGRTLNTRVHIIHHGEQWRWTRLALWGIYSMTMFVHPVKPHASTTRIFLQHTHTHTHTHMRKHTHTFDLCHAAEAWHQWSHILFPCLNIELDLWAHFAKRRYQMLFVSCVWFLSAGCTYPFLWIPSAGLGLWTCRVHPSSGPGGGMGGWFWFWVTVLMGEGRVRKESDCSRCDGRLKSILKSPRGVSSFFWRHRSPPLPLHPFFALSPSKLCFSFLGPVPVLPVCFHFSSGNSPHPAHRPKPSG